VTGSLDTAHPGPARSPGLALWRITNSWQRATRAALAPHGLTYVQFVLLASLTWMDRGTPVTQRDLAHHAGTDPMTTSQVLRALETKGLITRTPHPGDGRAWALTPTRKGKRLASRANLAVEAADRAHFAALGRASGDFLNHLRDLDRAHRRQDPHFR
jgi:MarR family transcriptional regulator, organic hydroperoxide resistance regulator